MGKIKKHHHEQIETKTRDNKRFCKAGDMYIAIHYKNDKVFLCQDSEIELSAGVLKGWFRRILVESNKNLEEITEAEFVAKFSDTVNKLHSQTPYA